MGHDFPLVWLIAAFVAYTALLFLISYLTSRNAGKNSFFGGERKAPWPIVAYGRVCACSSGVTFISVPGNVWVQNFFYMPLVFGFVVGYIVIAKVNNPLTIKRLNPKSNPNARLSSTFSNQHKRGEAAAI